jgi:hypothetical protein
VGVGGWGVGPQAPIPNPQSPIPNPHKVNYYIYYFYYLYNKNNFQKNDKKYNIKIT